MPRTFRDLSGQEFGRWVVLRHSHRGPTYQQYWWVRCSCGFERTVTTGVLIAGKSTMCRKCSFVVIGARNKTHGHTAKGKMPTRAYTAYTAAKGRVTNTKNKYWDLYGGRGIKMCRRWAEAFENFFEDMGHCADKLSLDRTDVDGHYSCGKCAECVANGWAMNCKWITQSEQCNNTRRCRFIEFEGKRQTISQWAREKGIHAGTLHDRLTYCKWTVERALNTPTINKGQMHRVGDMVICPSFFI